MATSAGETRVDAALSKFLKQHNLHDHVNDIDEIVLSYVVSMLEDLGDSGNAEENIDVDQFVEMVDAYIPGFASIDRVAVCEWMFELASSLSKPEVNGPISPSIDTSVMMQACAPSLVQKQDVDSAGESERSNSESSVDEVDEQLQTLIEMFPSTVRLELEHCLHGADGDLDRAVQLILHRDEAGMAITEQNQTTKKTKTGQVLVPDKKDKERLMARYAFIDVDEDKRVFKPPPPKHVLDNVINKRGILEPKKLVRYLDSQVVNTKGHKFTEIKRDDEEEMKKTYINLKPARKYRFH